MNATPVIPALLAETLTIRLAVPADAPALARLAQLDSAPRPAPVPMLIAEIGGELRAAVPLDGGRAISDPFHPTAALVALLTERTLRVAPPRRRRRRLTRVLRPSRALPA